MKQHDFEIEEYMRLNQYSKSNGIVIFGGKQDGKLPLCEIKQYFDLEENFYNRSFENLSIIDAIPLYKKCIAPLEPESVLLHLGEADVAFFEDNNTHFDSLYCNLIQQIRDQNSACRISIVGLANKKNDVTITSLNRHLKIIAQSESCEFNSLCEKKLWTPRATKEISSFLESLGMLRGHKLQRNHYDLVRMIYLYNGIV